MRSHQLLGTCINLTEFCEYCQCPSLIEGTDYRSFMGKDRGNNQSRWGGSANFGRGWVASWEMSVAVALAMFVTSHEKQQELKPVFRRDWFLHERHRVSFPLAARSVCATSASQLYSCAVMLEIFAPKLFVCLIPVTNSAIIMIYYLPSLSPLMMTIAFQLDSLVHLKTCIYCSSGTRPTSLYCCAKFSSDCPIWKYNLPLDMLDTQVKLP